MMEKRGRGRPKKATSPPELAAVFIEEEGEESSSSEATFGSHTMSRRSNKIYKEADMFLADFRHESSARETRKLNKKCYKDGKGRGKATLYDEKGILLSADKDLCDCMEEACPGCHFPCNKCRSNKCGHECRQNRKWVFDCVELDGVPGSIRHNPYSLQDWKM